MGLFVINDGLKQVILSFRKMMIVTIKALIKTLMIHVTYLIM